MYSIRMIHMNKYFTSVHKFHSDSIECILRLLHLLFVFQCDSMFFFYCLNAAHWKINHNKRKRLKMNGAHVCARSSRISVNFSMTMYKFILKNSDIMSKGHCLSVGRRPKFWWFCLANISLCLFTNRKPSFIHSIDCCYRSVCNWQKLIKLANFRA